MRKFNAIIIDDEPYVRKALEIMILAYCPQIIIAGKAGSAKEGRELLEKNKVELIFLDISMPNENGFEFLATIDKEKYAIVFTTAYEEFALKAIKANAIDYLLKPIDPNELAQAVSKVISYLNLRSSNIDAREVYSQSLENLMAMAEANSVIMNKITVPEQFGFRIVEVKNIRYIEADSNYSILHLSEYEKIVSSKSLGEYEKILEAPMFFRIHKSTIINMNYLKSFSNYQGHFAILNYNTKLIISRRRVNEFREAVNQFTKTINKK